MEPKRAQEFYQKFVQQLKASIPVKEGIFGADMEVTIVNDGPVTFFLRF